jgi:hypothetical protein
VRSFDAAANPHVSIQHRRDRPIPGWLSPRKNGKRHLMLGQIKRGARLPLVSLFVRTAWHRIRHIHFALHSPKQGFLSLFLNCAQLSCRRHAGEAGSLIEIHQCPSATPWRWAQTMIGRPKPRMPQNARMTEDTSNARSRRLSAISTLVKHVREQRQASDRLAVEKPPLPAWRSRSARC